MSRLPESSNSPRSLKTKIRNNLALWTARLLGPIIALGLYPGSEGDHVLHEFYMRCKTFEKPRVLELGTSRSIPDRSTRHEEWVRHAGEYLGTDIAPGADVDIVADVHRLTQVTGVEQFDVIISCSTFEHFKYPHIAAHEVMKALRIGGVLFIQTHQAYPLHAYPYDYFRYSKEALAGLFGTSMGFHTIATGYEFSARVFGGKDHLGTRTATELRPAFLNVSLYGEKVARTPDEYIYEYDTSLPV